MQRTPILLTSLLLTVGLLAPQLASARPTAKQVNIGKRFAVQGLSGGASHYKLLDRQTGRTAPLYGDQYDAKRTHAVIKGTALSLSGWQIGKVSVAKINTLGVRVGVHTNYLAPAFQLTDAKGWRKDGDVYVRNAKVNGKRRQLMLAITPGGEKERIGSLYVMGKAGLKQRVAEGLHKLADRLVGKSAPQRFVPKSAQVYSEAN